MQDLNSVTLVARLVRDPEVRTIPASGQSVCNLRVAFNKSVKDNATGAWKDVGCFVGVTVWGSQADSCAKYLSKGRQVAIKGRLDFREWEQEGQKRNEVSIVADQVQFIGGNEGTTLNSSPTSSDVPVTSPVPF